MSARLVISGIGLANRRAFFYTSCDCRAETLVINNLLQRLEMLHEDFERVAAAVYSNWYFMAQRETTCQADCNLPKSHNNG
jgi:hypothetical protein